MCTVPRPEKSRGSSRSSQGGQTLVEFALVISILFLIVFGIFEFSRLFFAYGTMSHGVREAARYAVIHPGPEHEADIIDEALSRIFLIGGIANVTVSYPDSVGGDPYCSHRCRVVVEATSTYNPWTPLVPSFEMVARATLHIE
jgi:Flp pilus assembly protein TadG